MKKRSHSFTRTLLRWALACLLAVAACSAPRGSAIVGAATLVAATADCDLRSRGFAGFGYRNPTEAERDSLRLASAEGAGLDGPDSTGVPDGRAPGPLGVIVTQVVEGAAADRAGLAAGDVLVRYCGEDIRDNSTLATLVRLRHAGDTARADFVRAGKRMVADLVLEAAPREAAADLTIEYTCFESDGTRLRAVVTSPAASGDLRLPALLMVSALASPRLVATPGYGAWRDLAHAIARGGFRVLRFELRGSGDSEGEDYHDAGFYDEVADNLAALDYLAARPDVDPARVFVMGHSTGGMIAAVIASRRATAGLVTSSTIGRTFYERSLETLRLQSELAGDSASVTDLKLKQYLDLMAAAARGDSLPAILERSPALAEYVNAQGRIMDDRNLAYWREQLNLNLPETYSKISEPVLVVYGASDFLTSLACHEHIRDVLLASGNPDVTLAVVPECDHAFAFAKDKRESHANYKTRNFRANPEPVQIIGRWLAEHTR
ncbi:MAG: alpha/beta fold hydrolase [bacterium]